MMRYHPWTWRPGTLPGMGAAEWLHDMVNTKRPLEEKMALFWHGIFATGVSKVDHYDDVMDMIVKFREKGMGDFRELLVEMAKDPAMIYWLDNCENHADAVNENWGRELLELFSMGVGNYTEVDVRECSRAFTGWTIEAQAAAPGPLAVTTGSSSIATMTTTTPRRPSWAIPATSTARTSFASSASIPPCAPLHRPPPVQLLRGRRSAGASLVGDTSQRPGGG